MLSVQATPLRKQSGAALVISLIILSIVTILGVSSMQSSSTELKMAASLRDRGIAFEAAEAALVIVEKSLADNPPERADLLSSCITGNCYNSSCNGGRCFDGMYPITSEFDCEVANGANVSERIDFWSDKTLDVWNSPARHQTLLVDNVTSPVKYIVEFLCYVPRDKDTRFSADPNEHNNGAPLFRITAMSRGNGNRSSVALQSTYKVLNGH